MIQLATALTSIVLVHGAFVDGSGWEGVYNVLKKDGYNVSIVQGPATSLADDVAATKRVLAAIEGPVVLVAHSYGGAVITEAGTDPKVAAVVYIAAFAPDKGESVAILLKDPTPSAAPSPIQPVAPGFLAIEKAKFHSVFAHDVPAAKTQFMADSQVPFSEASFTTMITDPAWRSKPSWYMVATADRTIPPALQKSMSKRAGSTVIEVDASHAVYVSKPKAVAAFIETAAKGVK